MRRPVGFPMLSAQQVADRAVGRYGVARGLYGAEMKDAVLARLEAPAQVHVSLIGVLVLIQADRRGVPDIDFHRRDRPILRVADVSSNKERRAGRGRTHNAGAI